MCINLRRKLLSLLILKYIEYVGLKFCMLEYINYQPLTVGGKLNMWSFFFSTSSTAMDTITNTG